MEDTITTIYCLCDDFLKNTRHRDDPQVSMSTAEVMTVSLVAAAFFGGNLDKSRLFLSEEYGYMKKMISKSRLNRRLHALGLGLWQGLFMAVGRTLQAAQFGTNLRGRFLAGAGLR